MLAWAKSFLKAVVKINSTVTIQSVKEREKEHLKDTKGVSHQRESH